MAEFRKSIDKQTTSAKRLPFTRGMGEPASMDGRVAHNFNNILTTIMGYTELLQEILANNENCSIHKYLNEIHACTGRAFDLVDNSLKPNTGGDNKTNADQGSLDPAEGKII